MGKITEFIKNFGEKSKEKRAIVNQMTEELRMQKIAEDRMKPSSQRLIERYEEEKAEKFRKAYLEKLEKERDNDFKFNHNPLNAKNVTGKAQWEVLKEKNIFSNNNNIFSKKSNMFIRQKNLFVNNKRCY